MAKPDLNKLKSEIDSRKKQRNMTASPLGEQVGTGIAPRDAFLYGLMESLNTGRETASSSLVKTVDNKVAAKKGEVGKLQIAETQQVQPQRPVQRPMQNIGEEMDMSPERDDLLYRDLETKRKQTIAESLEQFSKTPAVGAPMGTKQQPVMGSPMQLNEAYLAESVQKIVNGYLTENLGPIFEEAIKNTIIEMYAVERIKEVLQENKEMLKGIMRDIIKESKANRAQP